MAAVIAAFAFTLLTAAISLSHAQMVCSVTDNGAVGDGKTNDTEAFLRTFLLCATFAGDHTVFVPQGTYLVWPLSIPGGECVNMEFFVAGTIVAPEDPASWPQNKTFFYFENCNHFTITGAGIGAIDGRGQNWWEIRKKDSSIEAPYLLTIAKSSNVYVHDISLLNSPMFHLVPQYSTNVLIERVNVSAPADSPNTDGIDPVGCQNVTIQYCSLSGGDDNVAIKAGSRDVLIRYNAFGSGHGCSIGSINDTGVQNVFVHDCSFVGTDNGARIKTWQGGSGIIANVTYQKLTMTQVGTPILITMYYCPQGGCKNSTKGVIIKDIVFDSIVASQTTGVAGQFLCSDAVPCMDIALSNISVTAHQGEKKNAFYCWSAYGTATNVEPASCLRT